MGVDCPNFTPLHIIPADDPASPIFHVGNVVVNESTHEVFTPSVVDGFVRWSRAAGKSELGALRDLRALRAFHFYKAYVGPKNSAIDAAVARTVDLFAPRRQNEAQLTALLDGSVKRLEKRRAAEKALKAAQDAEKLRALLEKRRRR